MATVPYFLLGPNAVLSLVGLVRGIDKTVATPTEDWREAKVDVVIPAYNEEETIVLCLDSLLRQTLKPHRVVLINDGSMDNTIGVAREFAAENGLDLEVVSHRSVLGKTHGLKEEARELDGDVEFVLDADTVLESENYLERVVQELYKGKGIASVCGTIMPLHEPYRKKVAARENVQRFYQEHPGLSYIPGRNRWHRFLRLLTNTYREFLYFFLQRFIYQGHMALFGSILNPVGCAVAYRRELIKDVFDKYEDSLGDNLTTSEDIFMGFALLEMGYRNIQIPDIQARSEEPEAQNVPGQLLMWSSAFLQSCYYFPDLLKSPFKALNRWKHERETRELGIEERRNVKEPYRQPIGVRHTIAYGRPIGWVIMLGLVEKIFFPSVILIMIILQAWTPLIITLSAELAILLVLTAIISHQYSYKYVVKALISTPMRYGSLLFDVVVIGRFLFDVTFKRNLQWRK